MEKRKLAHSEGEIAFKNAVQKEYLKRVQRNSQYSMRSFAKQLGIDQSLLSKVVNSKRRVSKKVIEEIGPKVNLTPSEISRCMNSRDKIEANIDHSTVIDEEFELLSSWHHFAILELMKTDGFISTYKFVSKRLNIPLSTAKDAIKRLKTLGFIEADDDKWILKKRDNSWTDNKFTSEARRQYQEQLAVQAAQSIRDVDFDRRDHGSITVAINTDRLPEFKERLKEIRRELDSYFQPQNADDYNEVYQLTISLFPVSINEES